MSSSAQTPGRGVGPGEIDLGVVGLVAREEVLPAHRLAEEVDDRVTPVERVGAAAVGGSRVVGEQLADVVPLLQVEVAEVRVLHPLDELDLHQVVRGQLAHE